MAFSVARILLLICAPAVVAASDSARQLRGSLATESGAHLDLQAHLRLVGACKRSSVPGSKQVSFLDIRENTEKKDPNGSKVNTADCSTETGRMEPVKGIHRLHRLDRKTFCELCVANPVKTDFIMAYIKMTISNPVYQRACSNQEIGQNLYRCRFRQKVELDFDNNCPAFVARRRGKGRGRVQESAGDGRKEEADEDGQAEGGGPIGGPIGAGQAGAAPASGDADAKAEGKGGQPDGTEAVLIKMKALTDSYAKVERDLTASASQSCRGVAGPALKMVASKIDANDLKAAGVETEIFTLSGCGPESTCAKEQGKLLADLKEQAEKANAAAKDAAAASKLKVKTAKNALAAVRDEIASQKKKDLKDAEQGAANAAKAQNSLDVLDKIKCRFEGGGHTNDAKEKETYDAVLDLVKEQKDSQAAAKKAAAQRVEQGKILESERKSQEQTLEQEAVRLAKESLQTDQAIRDAEKQADILAKLLATLVNKCQQNDESYQAQAAINGKKQKSIEAIKAALKTGKVDFAGLPACSTTKETTNGGSADKGAADAKADPPTDEVEGETTKGACTDLPVGWMSTTNANCQQYKEFKWCTADGKYGTGWHTSLGTFARWAVGGIDASQACCACGGGTTAAPAEGKSDNSGTDTTTPAPEGKLDNSGTDATTPAAEGKCSDMLHWSSSYTNLQGFCVGQVHDGKEKPWLAIVPKKFGKPVDLGFSEAWRDASSKQPCPPGRTNNVKGDSKQQCITDDLSLTPAQHKTLIGGLKHKGAGCTIGRQTCDDIKTKGWCRDGANFKKQWPMRQGNEIWGTQYNITDNFYGGYGGTAQKRPSKDDAWTIIAASKACCVCGGGGSGADWEKAQVEADVKYKAWNRKAKADKKAIESECKEKWPATKWWKGGAEDHVNAPGVCKDYKASADGVPRMKYPKGQWDKKCEKSKCKEPHKPPYSTLCPETCGTCGPCSAESWTDYEGLGLERPATK